MNEVAYLFCRHCGYDIRSGYNYQGYCAVCAEGMPEQDADQEFLQRLREAAKDGDKINHSDHTKARK